VPPRRGGEPSSVCSRDRTAARVALLLYEIFSPSIAAELRRRGHDVTAVAAEPQLRSMSDPELYAWATAGGRRIVTENVKEFRRLLMQEREPTGPGLLFTSVRTFRGVDVLQGRSSMH